MLFFVAGCLCLFFVAVLLLVWRQVREPAPSEDAAKPREWHAARTDADRLVCATCAMCVVLSCVLFALHVTVPERTVRAPLAPAGGPRRRV